MQTLGQQETRKYQKTLEHMINYLYGNCLPKKENYTSLQMETKIQ